MERGHKLHHFGPFCLDIPERVLLRDGRIVPLPAKVMSTLLVLVRSEGHVVEKDVLMQEVWPNEFVEEGNLAQNIFILRKALGESCGEPKYIETVPRRGYRFLSGVRTTKVFVTNDNQTSAESRSEFCLLAVLPLVNANGNHDVEYLSESITESIINALAQFPELRVMAHNTVFHYKNRELDVRKVGRELGVHNVLVGTLQSQGDMLVLSIELIDAAGGWRLCGKTYRRKFNDILQTQDAIAQEISTAVRTTLQGIEE